MRTNDPLIAPVLRPGAVIAVEANGDPRQQAFQRALAGQMGNTMQGDVLGKLSDGNFLVRVAGVAARMQLPQGAQAGTPVQLTLVALHPRPTFQVGASGLTSVAHAEPDTPPPAGGGPALPDGDTAAESLAARTPLTRAGEGLAGGTPLTRTAALHASLAPPQAQLAAGGQSADTTLSPAARTISTVLAAAMKADPPLTAVKGQDPLLPQPTPDAPRIAAALQQAMTKSGLFYESHVAEWAQGQRAMTDLSSEPQMVQARAGTPFVATEPATAQFISLQLSSQEQGQVAWHGQLWPGQPMQWQIQKDAPKREHQADGEEASTWQSRLRLRFAQLGELDARIVLDGQRLHVRLRADSEAARARLDEHASRLLEALEAAGTPLASLAIRSTGKVDD